MREGGERMGERDDREQGKRKRKKMRERERKETERDGKCEKELGTVSERSKEKEEK